MCKRIFILTLLLSLAILTGCSSDSDPLSADFGADYSIVVTGDLPAVSSNTLRVILFYIGCEPNHEFTLNTEETGNNEYRVWLTKNTPNQDCQQSFEELREFPLPEETNGSRIVFIAPNFEGVLREI